MLYDSTWHKMVIRKLLKLDINLYESWWPVKSANAHTYTFTHSQLYKKYGFRRRIGGNFFQFHKCTGWSVTDKISDLIEYTYVFVYVILYICTYICICNTNDHIIQLSHNVETKSPYNFDFIFYAFFLKNLYKNAATGRSVNRYMIWAPV